MIVVSVVNYLLFVSLYVICCYFVICYTLRSVLALCVSRHYRAHAFCWQVRECTLEAINVSPRRQGHVIENRQSIPTSNPEGRKLARQSRHVFLGFARVSAKQLFEIARCDLVWALLGQIRERQKCSLVISNV